MGFRETIEVLLKVDSNGAVSGIKSFRQSVADADGVTGKFKAAAGGAFEYAKQHATAMALAAGAALATFAIKAVGAFTDTAKAAIDLGKATGLATEDASRWIAVGDDMGVSAEQLTAGLGKVAKSLDDTKWGKYGIATRDAAGNARNANDILIDTFDMLGKIENGTERARIGNELFGKGYSNLAPLIGKSADEYERMLGAVESGQVITTKEAEKAEKMRLAQDALQDAIGEVTLAVGGLVANLAPLIERTSEAATKFTEMIGPVLDVATSLDAMDIGQHINDMGLFGDAIDKTSGKLLGKFDPAAGDAADALDEFESAMDSAAGKAGELGDKTAEVAEKTRDYDAAVSEAEQAVLDLDGAYQTLMGHLDNREAWRNVEESLASLKEKVGDSESSWNDLEGATDDAVKAVADYIEGLDGIAPEVKTRLITDLDEGHLNAVLLQLNSLREDINVKVKVNGPGTVGYEKKAKGGPVRAGQAYVVGDNPDGSLNSTSELFVPDSSGTIVPAGGFTEAGATGGSGSGATVVHNHFNIQTNYDDRRLIQTLRQYQKRGGRL